MRWLVRSSALRKTFPEHAGRPGQRGGSAPRWAPSFDDKVGMGAVPNNADVDYFGFRTHMTPGEFLGLNPARVLPPAPEMVDRMREGTPIGHPFMDVQREGDHWRVTGHEGRGRVMAMQSLGHHDPIEVHVFPRGERARDLSDKDRARGFLPDKRTHTPDQILGRPEKPTFGKSFPAHAGRPGQRGGSAPRGDGGQTQTPAFKQWFGDSKVVDEHGEPLVVYHGTQADFESFKPGRIWFAVTPRYANIYGDPRIAGPARNLDPQSLHGNVMPLYVALQKPRVYRGREGWQQWTTEQDGDLLGAGYDGVLFKQGKTITVGYALKPTQVKSALGNRGTFDPKDPTITKDFDPQKHPHAPAGPGGGQFVETGGSATPAATGPSGYHDIFEVFPEHFAPKPSAPASPAPQPDEQIVSTTTTATAHTPEGFQAEGQTNADAEMQARLNVEAAQGRTAVAALVEKVAGTPSPESPTPPGGSPQDEYEDEDESTPPPESWDELSGDQQEETEAAWKKHSYNEFHQSEVDSYYENQAPEDARGKVSEDADWREQAAYDALDELGADTKWLDQNRGHLSEWVSIDASQGSWPQKTDITVDPELWDKVQWKSAEELRSMDALEPGETWPPYQITPKEQGTFSGMEPDEEPWAPTEETFVKDMTTRFDKEVEHQTSNMDVPDYIAESVSEYQDEYWSQLSDKEKFSKAQDYLDSSVFEPEAPAEKPEEPETVTVPKTFKVFKDGEDYAKTAALGRALVLARATEIAQARGLKRQDGQPVGEDEMAVIENKVWGSWKDSSTSAGGVALQLATARELGTPHTLTEGQVAQAERVGREVYYGGMAGLQAYVRANWETTQYLLDKAGLKAVNAYRGLVLPGEAVDATPHAAVGHAAGLPTQLAGYASDYESLPELQLLRNGAASFTAKAMIANGWNGVGTLPPDPRRVVLRAQVPATAVLSLPVYGKNLSNEEEIVVTGAPWKYWDAWNTRAPTFDRLPPESLVRGPHGQHVEVQKMAEIRVQGDYPQPHPLIVDLDGAPGSPHWLSQPPMPSIAEWMRAKRQEAKKFFQGHTGRPGQRGGSSPRGFAAAFASTTRRVGGVEVRTSTSFGQHVAQRVAGLKVPDVRITHVFQIGPDYVDIGFVTDSKSASKNLKHAVADKLGAGHDVDRTYNKEVGFGTIHVEREEKVAKAFEGHAGRPGQVGGSAPRGEGGDAAAREREARASMAAAGIPVPTDTPTALSEISRSLGGISVTAEPDSWYDPNQHHELAKAVEKLPAFTRDYLRDAAKPWSVKLASLGADGSDPGTYGRTHYGNNTIELFEHQDWMNPMGEVFLHEMGHVTMEGLFTKYSEVPAFNLAWSDFARAVRQEGPSANFVKENYTDHPVRVTIERHDGSKAFVPTTSWPAEEFAEGFKTAANTGRNGLWYSLRDTAAMGHPRVADTFAKVWTFVDPEFHPEPAPSEGAARAMKKGVVTVGDHHGMRHRYVLDGDGTIIETRWDAPQGVAKSFVGHAGRPGQVGGSAPSGEESEAPAKGKTDETSWEANATADQKAALERYTSEGGEFFTINDALREGKMPADPHERADFEAIHEAIAKSPVWAAPKQLYRGIYMPVKGSESRPALEAIVEKFRDAAAKGGTVTMKGIISTSDDPNVPGRFGGHTDGGVTLKILAKQGISVRNVSKLGEDEVLLDHNSKFKVTGFKDETNPYNRKETYHVVTMEQML